MDERGGQNPATETQWCKLQPAGHQHHKLVHHLKMMPIILKGAPSLFGVLYSNVQG